MRRPLTAVVMLLALVGCEGSPHVAGTATAERSAVAALTSSAVEAEGHARADRPRSFAFPTDHGPHPDFQTEWWYVTGNLAAADGRRFGFQWTLFRRALAPPTIDPDPGSRPSRWATRQLYMAHFAVTDAAAGRHLAAERFARGAVGLAGARAAPFAAWLEGWRLASRDEGALWPLRLEAAAADFAIDLELGRGKPLVLQGDAGLSRKNALPGGASYYYSYPRLPAAGRIEIDGREIAVRGTAWLDREWSTSVLAPEQAGWDWFALQLDDGRELMVYHLRRTDGTVDPFSAGVVVAAEGAVRRLAATDFTLVVTDTWTSPRSGAVYPSRWRLRVPAAGLDLAIAPLVADQELDVSFRYWEGAVEVAGSVAGRGYVELVGYGATE